MTTPLARYALGLLLGFLAAISITGGMFIVFVPVTIAVCVVIAAIRSIPAFAGALCSFGLTWFLLIGSTYVRCTSMGPDCVMGGGELVFVAAGFLLLVGGLAVTGALVFEGRRTVR